MPYPGPATKSARMLRRLYDRLLALAAGPNAEWWLAAIAFAEASFFPLPPDLLLIPMVIARPDRAWRIAAICTVSSVAGGALGWLIGATLFDQVALPIAHLYHAEPTLLRFAERFRENGLWVVLVKGLTPIPYKIVSIAAGAAHFSLPLFLVASALTRGLRFFVVAGLLRIYGDRARHFVEHRLTLVTTVLVVVMIGALVVVKYV